MSVFKAGAASVIVPLGDDCFPNAESIAKHDDVYVRVVIFETDRRYAILSADMPSMLPHDLRFCKDMLEEVAGVAQEDSWVTVTHSYCAPHTWPKGDHEQDDTPRPMPLKNNPHIAQVATRINKANRYAYRKATDEALANMREATVGFGTGTCAVNINKNIPTVNGWWQGASHEGFVDRTLGVMRINGLDGEPIAILFNYSVQNSVGVGPIAEYGKKGKVASADLIGVASAYVEKEYGGNCTAIVLCGAQSDQVPLFKINYTETDRFGKHRSGSYGAAGYILMEAQGRALGNAILQTSEKIKCEDNAPEIRTAQRTYTCKCQERETDIFNLRPVLSYEFVPDGERELTVDAMIIGDIALIGLLPEMDGITVAEIREGSPYDQTMVAAYVNGNGKSMPQKESYTLLQHSAINSPYVEGSAELTRDVALELLKDMKKS